MNVHDRVEQMGITAQRAGIPRAENPYLDIIDTLPRDPHAPCAGGFLMGGLRLRRQ
jgi:hypothetical protein